MRSFNTPVSRLLSRPRLIGAGLFVVLIAMAPAARAAERHARLAALPTTYVAIGASDAVGVGADDPVTQSWPAVLAAQLPRGSHFINLGVPGITLGRALRTELPVALDALTAARAVNGGDRPLVTVWLVVNDMATGVSLTSYAADLQILLHVLSTQTHARVVVGNVPDLTLLPAARRYDPRTVGRIVRAWNVVIAATVKRNKAVLVDLYRGWRELALHPEYIGADGFHPSTDGYRRLAALFWSATAR